MSTETMSSRERMLASFHQREVDRFPVWLKMANPTWQLPQPEPYRSMDGEELLRAAGCDVMVGNGVPYKTITPHVTVNEKKEGNDQIRIYSTPDGELTAIDTFTPETCSTHPTKHPVETKEDLAAARWLFKDNEYQFDADATTNARTRQNALIERDAVSMCGIGPGPFMNCIEHLCGPENTVFLQIDEPELFSDLLAEMHASRTALLKELLPRCQADTFWLTENTSTSLISPTQFKEFCMPHLQVYGQMILDHGIIPVHHMCGTLNALLELINELPAMVNEAYTTRPLGDVSLAEGRQRMPSKALIGGTNATLWLEEPDVIVDTVRKDLAECNNKRGIFLTSAGVLPPLVSFEKAKEVVHMLKELK